VAAGEAPFGIVYETDALVEPKVKIVDVFPEASHPPIVYPAALLKGARPGAEACFAVLKGPRARAIFARYGFRPIL
jgi:molybdate transport system substrate-binding protein